MIAEPGDAMDRFMLAEEGEIEVVSPITSERALESTLGPGEYMGDIPFLSGGTLATGMRAVRDTRVVAVPAPDMLALMARMPEMSDTIVRVRSRTKPPTGSALRCESPTPSSAY